MHVTDFKAYNAGARFLFAEFIYIVLLFEWLNFRRNDMIKLIVTDTCNFFRVTTNDKFSFDKSHIQIYATLSDIG